MEVASLSNVPSGADCVIPESVTWQDTQYSVVAIGFSNTYSSFWAKTVSIPASIADIEIHSLYDTPILTDILVDEQNPSFCSVDGVLFNKNVTQILMYPAGRPDTTYSIPSTVTAVGDDAFKYCRNLQEIILPPTIESIGVYSFAYCYSLISMDFPDSVKFIDFHAMDSCISLRTVSIGKSLAMIGDWNPFCWCNSLTDINVDKENKNFCSIEGALYRNLDSEELELVAFPLGRNADLYSFPNKATVIGSRAFSGYNTSSDLVLPNTIKGIGQCAFSYSSLKSITIPASVSRIDSQPFLICDELSEIIVDTENPVYSSENGVLYNKDRTSLLCFPAGHPAIEFDIPEGVSEIGEYAFRSCKKIEKINIPESVTNIGYMAFEGSTSLKSIIIPNSVEAIKGSILSGCENLQSATIGSSVRLIEGGDNFERCPNISTITCLPTVPPEARGDGHFDTEVYETATLYVPNGCKEAYSTAEIWSKFQNIVEMEPVGISDINAADEGVAVTVENGAIVVTGADGSDVVEVYAADGRCVYRGNGTEIAGLAGFHGIFCVDHTMRLSVCS